MSSVSPSGDSSVLNSTVPIYAQSSRSSGIRDSLELIPLSLRATPPTLTRPINPRTTSWVSFNHGNGIEFDTPRIISWLSEQNSFVEGESSPSDDMPGSYRTRRKPAATRNSSSGHRVAFHAGLDLNAGLSDLRRVRFSFEDEGATSSTVPPLPIAPRIVRCGICFDDELENLTVSVDHCDHTFCR